MQRQPWNDQNNWDKCVCERTKPILYKQCFGEIATQEAIWTTAEEYCPNMTELQ